MLNRKEVKQGRHEVQATMYQSSMNYELLSSGSSSVCVPVFTSFDDEKLC